MRRFPRTHHATTNRASGQPGVTRALAWIVLSLQPLLLSIGSPRAHAALMRAFMPPARGDQRGSRHASRRLGPDRRAPD
jgi:hypothetical protein